MVPVPGSWYAEVASQTEKAAEQLVEEDDQAQAHTRKLVKSSWATPAGHERTRLGSHLSFVSDFWWVTLSLPGGRPAIERKDRRPGAQQMEVEGATGATVEKAVAEAVDSVPEPSQQSRDRSCVR